MSDAFLHRNLIQLSRPQKVVFLIQNIYPSLLRINRAIWHLINYNGSFQEPSNDWDKYNVTQ